MRCGAGVKEKGRMKDDSQVSGLGHWLDGEAYGRGGRLWKDRDGKFNEMKMSESSKRKCQAGNQSMGRSGQI